MYLAIAEEYYQDEKAFGLIKDLLSTILSKEYGLYEDELLSVGIEEDEFFNKFGANAYRLEDTDQPTYERFGFYLFTVALIKRVDK